MQLGPFLPDLPTEVIENISRSFDDDPTTWFAFRLTCRAIRSKSLHPFGERFFTTLKFCLHPISLQVLTDISYNPDFASRVRNIAFGTEYYGLIDPLHDGAVKQAGLIPATSTRHPPVKLNAMDDTSLLSARVRTDSTIIAQALSRFPRLGLLMVGNELELRHVPVRDSWGRGKISMVKCETLHCKPNEYERTDLDGVFVTTMLALQQLQGPEIKICARIDRSDHDFAQDLDVFWHPVDDTRSQLHQLQLVIDPSNTNSLHEYIYDLCEGSQIEELVVNYESPYDSPFLIQGLGLAHYPLDRLTHVTLKDGGLSPTELALFFQAHSGRLRYVSLVDCLVVQSQMTTSLTANDSDTDAWLQVLWALTELPHPTFSEEDILVHSFEESMSFSANWKGAGEVSIGLKYLIRTYQISRFCTSARGTEAGSFRYPTTLPGFLVLRWANFKASPVCGWTQREANILYTRQMNTQHDSVQGGDKWKRLPIDDPELFSLEGYEPVYLFEHPFLARKKDIYPKPDLSNTLRAGVQLINPEGGEWRTIWFQDEQYIGQD